MRLIVSTSLQETAEHFWALRTLAERIARPVTALLARRRDKTAYDGLSPHILDDIGLPARSSSQAETLDRSRRAVAACVPADAYWPASDLDPFARRVPFGKPRGPETTPAFKAYHIASASGRPAVSRAERFDARIPFAGVRLPLRARRSTPAEVTQGADRINARVPFAKAKPKVNTANPNADRAKRDQADRDSEIAA